MSDNNLTSNSPSSGTMAVTVEKPGHFVDTGAPLPENYGETRIVLLPRDPNWMFTYWEITEQSAKDIKNKYGENIFVTAQSIIRMNEINAQNLQPIRFVDIAVSLDARNWYLRSDKQGTSWFVELGLKTADGRFILIAKSNLVTLPMGSVSDILDEKWVSIKEDLEKMLKASGGGKVGMGSLELARMLAQRWEMLSQISSWKGSGGVSSFGGQTGPEKLRGFWLVADCELVLYGATEPTATVTVAGKPVELFPDGTFSLRFALPDGNLDLPVKAISGDRVEERWIKISVERKPTERG